MSAQMMHAYIDARVYPEHGIHGPAVGSLVWRCRVFERDGKKDFETPSCSRSAEAGGGL